MARLRYSVEARMFRTLLLAVALLSCCASQHPPDPALLPPQVVESPGPDYGADQRHSQGVPGIERTPDGRLWAIWVTGPESRQVESPASYVVLATSADDGATWSELRYVIEPHRLVRAMSPALWTDPAGRLWAIWTQSAGLRDGRWGVWTMVAEDPESDAPDWSMPRRISNGVLLNKPTVLSSGDWLLPVAMWPLNTPELRLEGYDLGPYTPEMLIHRDMGAEKLGSNVYVSRDQGETFEFLGQARVPSTRVDEHMLVERLDGSIWMVVRTTYGLGQSVSLDGGRTWSPGEPYIEDENVANKRFFLRRLQSGALLMVRHNGPDGKRSHLTAFVSDNDGATWQGGLLLDERDRVSYPDGVQAPDGVIYLIYDYDRAGEGVIQMATFREQDVRSGVPVTPAARLRMEINRLKP